MRWHGKGRDWKAFKDSRIMLAGCRVAIGWQAVLFWGTKQGRCSAAGDSEPLRSCMYSGDYAYLADAQDKPMALGAGDVRGR